MVVSRAIESSGVFEFFVNLHEAGDLETFMSRETVCTRAFLTMM
jgi:hypothetical protein